MRFMLLLILILLAIFHFIKDPPPRPVEETFIGPQIETLKKMEGYEDQYLKSVEEQQKKMEEELKKSGG
jgi:hypothetical protein